MHRYDAKKITMVIKHLTYGELEITNDNGTISAVEVGGDGTNYWPNSLLNEGSLADLPRNSILSMKDENGEEVASGLSASERLWCFFNLKKEYPLWWYSPTEGKITLGKIPEDAIPMYRSWAVSDVIARAHRLGLKFDPYAPEKELGLMTTKAEPEKTDPKLSPLSYRRKMEEVQYFELTESETAISDLANLYAKGKNLSEEVDAMKSKKEMDRISSNTQKMILQGEEGNRQEKDSIMKNTKKNGMGISL